MLATYLYVVSASLKRSSGSVQPMEVTRVATIDGHRYAVTAGPDRGQYVVARDGEKWWCFIRPGRLELVKWGLPKHGHGLGVNVRVETVARAPSYGESFWHRRCLVVVGGFYEWKPAGKTKQPFRMRRTDGKPFALAGIWQHTTTNDGEIVDACAIITGPANGVVAPLHDRMPIVVQSQGYERWLSADARTPELPKLVETDASTLTSYPVNPIVNSAQNDDPRCIQPLA